MGQSSRKAGSSVGVAPVADETAATSEAARKKRSTESASEVRRRREAGRLGVRGGGGGEQDGVGSEGRLVEAGGGRR